MIHRNLVILSCGLWIAACGGRSSESPQTSTTSSFTFQELESNTGNPVWDSVHVQMDRTLPSSRMIEKTLARHLFANGPFEDLALKVEYGTYKIELKYSEKNKLTYQSCPGDLAKEHPINSPEYTAVINVCPVSSNGTVSDEVAGTVELAPSASVSIRPKLNGGGASTNANPFVGMELFVNESYRKSVEISAMREPSLAGKMEKLKSVSTAIWIDTTAKVAKIEEFLTAARKEQTTSGRKQMLTFVVYNLPERDCAANASNGQLTVANNGMLEYKSKYIDAIAQIFSRYEDLKITAIIEPDSLPNIATNLNRPKCQVADRLYRDGTAYAIQKLFMKHVSLYLDAAHGGWLGWPQNRSAMARIFKEVLDQAGGVDKIRGFATNVSNYSALRIEGNDPNPESFYEFNPARDELSYVSLLTEELAKVGIKDKGFIIDTSRNGQIKTRKIRGSWCNVKGAGLGERPQINPASGIDAYLWVKPPGESDGISNSSASRFDSMCASEDSMTQAPEAGEWFHEQFKMLVTNAFPAL